ncbi:hypothetical protein Tco_1524989 [Tanacetum coccineum]
MPAISTSLMTRGAKGTCLEGKGKCKLAQKRVFKNARGLRGRIEAISYFSLVHSYIGIYCPTKWMFKSDFSMASIDEVVFVINPPGLVESCSSKTKAYKKLSAVTIEELALTENQQLEYVAAANVCGQLLWIKESG